MLHQPRKANLTTLFVHYDSSISKVPTANNAPSRFAVRSPFEAIPYIALRADGTFYYSTGFAFALQHLDASGRFLRSVALPAMVSKMTRARADSLALTWPLRGSPIAPDSLFRRIVASDTQFLGIALGRVVCNEESVCLVHRRDLDDNPVTAVGVRHYDTVLPNGTIPARVATDSGIALLSWHGNLLAARLRKAGARSQASDTLLLLRFRYRR